MDALNVCDSCQKRIEKSNSIEITEIVFKGQSAGGKTFCSADCVIEWLINLDESQPKNEDDANRIFD